MSVFLTCLLPFVFIAIVSCEGRMRTPGQDNENTIAPELLRLFRAEQARQWQARPGRDGNDTQQQTASTQQQLHYRGSPASQFRAEGTVEATGKISRLRDAWFGGSAIRKPERTSFAELSTGGTIHSIAPRGADRRQMAARSSMPSTESLPSTHSLAADADPRPLSSLAASSSLEPFALDESQLATEQLPDSNEGSVEFPSGSNEQESANDVERSGSRNTPGKNEEPLQRLDEGNPQSPGLDMTEAKDARGLERDSTRAVANIRTAQKLQSLIQSAADAETRANEEEAHRFQAAQSFMDERERLVDKTSAAEARANAAASVRLKSARNLADERNALMNRITKADALTQEETTAQATLVQRAAAETEQLRAQATQAEAAAKEKRVWRQEAELQVLDQEEQFRQHVAQAETNVKAEEEAAAQTLQRINSEEEAMQSRVAAAEKRAMDIELSRLQDSSQAETVIGQLRAQATQAEAKAKTLEEASRQQEAASRAVASAEDAIEEATRATSAALKEVSLLAQTSTAQSLVDSKPAAVSLVNLDQRSKVQANETAYADCARRWAEYVHAGVLEPESLQRLSTTPGTSGCPQLLADALTAASSLSNVSRVNTDADLAALVEPRNEGEFDSSANKSAPVRDGSQSKPFVLSQVRGDETIDFADSKPLDSSSKLMEETLMNAQPPGNQSPPRNVSLRHAGGDSIHDVAKLLQNKAPDLIPYLGPLVLAGVEQPSDISVLQMKDLTSKDIGMSVVEAERVKQLADDYNA